MMEAEKSRYDALVAARKLDEAADYAYHVYKKLEEETNRWQVLHENMLESVP